MVTCMKCSQESSDIIKLSKCQHILCDECLTGILDNLTRPKIPCPIKGCTKTISDSIIRQHLSNDQLVTYDKLCYGSNNVKCLIKDCPYIIAYDKLEGHFICEICRQPNCLTCGKLHDIDDNCPSDKDYKIKKYEEAAYPSIQSYRKNTLVNISDTSDLILNSDKFDCPICCGTILPRKGLTLRNCMDNFCEPCMSNYLSGIDNLNNLNCPTCFRPLTQKECRKFLGNIKIQHLSLAIVKPKMFNCQSPSCDGLWDFAASSGIYKCKVCGKINCGYCLDVHEGQTCEDFRKTSRFKQSENFKRDLKNKNNITCKNCQSMIVKDGGCNAIRCQNCNLQVCAYTGMEVGPKGCKCTNSKRCVEGCHPGCIPEGPGVYEKELAKYFWNN